MQALLLALFLLKLHLVVFTGIFYTQSREMLSDLLRYFDSSSCTSTWIKLKSVISVRTELSINNKKAIQQKCHFETMILCFC